MNIIEKWNKLVENRNQIDDNLDFIEKEYIAESVRVKGIKEGDLVKCPKSGHIGFFKYNKTYTTRFKNIEFWLKAVKKDGTESLQNISHHCKFEELLLVNKDI